MSDISLEDIKLSFNKNICIYIGKEKSQNYDENQLRSKIISKAYENKLYYVELSKIIIEHLTKDKIDYKIRLFDIIDLLFKNDVGNYIEQLNKYLVDNFKECFMYSNLADRTILFKIYYTWKYIVPKTITEKIRIELNMDDFKELYMRENPDDIKVCDEYNENLRKKIMNKKIGNKEEKINNSEEKEKNEKIFLNKKRNSSNENKSSDASSITKKKKKVKLDKSNINLSNSNNYNNCKTTAPVPTIINNTISKPINMSNNFNNPTNSLFPQISNNVNNNINNPNQNNILFINTNQNVNHKTVSSSSEQQQMVQILNMLRNNPLNLINNFPFIQNSQKVSQIEINIFKFINESNIKLDQNLRFFSSLAKFFNESVKNKDTIKINCEYENIYKNQEYQQIRQYLNNSLFYNIKKNACIICGFRTLYYNKFIEHLDIHFNINYLKKEGKNLFRKIGNNRNYWIYEEGSNRKNINDLGYTLNNLIYYKNMMNKNIINVNTFEQENGNEEYMYPIDDNNIRNCDLCGDEFKRIFSVKYHYWFYTEIIKIKEEKTRLLVHKTCYDDIIKKT